MIWLLKRVASLTSSRQPNPRVWKSCEVASFEFEKNLKSNFSYITFWNFEKFSKISFLWLFLKQYKRIDLPRVIKNSLKRKIEFFDGIRSWWWKFEITWFHLWKKWDHVIESVTISPSDGVTIVSQPKCSKWVFKLSTKTLSADQHTYERWFQKLCLYTFIQRILNVELYAVLL